MSMPSRIRRASYLENHPALVLVILLLWEPFTTSLYLWESIKRHIQEFWQAHYIAPKEQAAPRENHVFFRGTINRPLTPPLERPRRVGSLLKPKRQQTHMQEQSILFSLPPELRVLIWKEVLSGYCAYPIDKQNWCFLQRKMIDRNTRHIAWSLSQPSPKLFDEKNGFTAKTHLLALPLSCRRIYYETIDLLYSSNIFHFRSGSGLLGIEKQRVFVGLSWPARPEFAWRVLPQRFNHIRCMILQHEVYYSPIPSQFLQGWFQLCRSLGDLPSLRALRIELDPRPGLQHQLAVFGFANPIPEPKMPDTVYMPLCSLRHLDIFDVVVFCTEGEALPVPSFTDLPFRLAIAQYPIPRLRRRRASQVYHHQHGDPRLLDSERWMRDALGMLKASLI
ncbi:uncharacterized protein PV09_04986 [Verruconis gallopava]|uniref:DUF7730 domain-containing protein n=1 Tax=Verruconis gallopava TaxID=253628 RepID=A0A0D2AWW5_9PEZI|nr:uncharacterized protein PV09_04986 [Verruconis gallopava]KIW03664.1 hypothetical protein PV09_04986 [Verruconis gallopava]